MRTLPVAILVLAVTVLVSATLAQDKTYDLHHLYKPVKGAKSEIAVSSVNQGVVRVTSGGQVVNEDKPDEQAVYALTQEVIDAKDEEILDARWTFAKATHTGDGKEVPYSFSGKTVHYTVGADGAQSFKLDDGSAVPAEEAAALAKDIAEHHKEGEPRGAEMFAPKNPVKVGESWTPDLAVMAKGMDMPIDLAKSKGTLTLKTVESRGGHDWGKIEGTIDFAVTEMGEAKFTEPLPISFDLTLEFFLDASSCDTHFRMKSRIDGKRSLAIPEGQGSAELEMKMDTNQEKTEKAAH